MAVFLPAAPAFGAGVISGTAGAAGAGAFAGAAAAYAVGDKIAPGASPAAKVAISAPFFYGVLFHPFGLGLSHPTQEPQDGTSQRLATGTVTHVTSTTLAYKPTDAYAYARPPQNAVSDAQAERHLEGGAPPTAPPAAKGEWRPLVKAGIYTAGGLVALDKLTTPNPGGTTILKDVTQAPGDLLKNTGEGAGAGFQGLFTGLGTGLGDAFLNLFRGIGAGSGEGVAQGLSGVGKGIMAIAVPAALVAGGVLVFKAVDKHTGRRR